MKNLSFLNVLMLALAIFGLSSCGSDDTTIVLGPDISFESGTGLVHADSIIAAGAEFTVRLVAAKGDNPMNSLTIQEDGVNVDFERISMLGSITVINNPTTIPAGEQESLTWDITIAAHTDERNAAYDFIIADEGAKSSTTETVWIDTENTVVATPPVVTFNGSNPLTVTPGSATVLKISAEATSDIASIGILKGGTLIDIAGIEYEEVQMDNNPQLLEAGSTSLSEAKITFPSITTGVYTFEVTDANGLVGSVDVTVVSGTTTTEIVGVLLNSAGPAGTGGLDLDSGTGTGSSDASADIKDEGINGNPAATNWIQKISAVNGAVLKYAGNLPDGSGYADVNTSEAIQGAFDNSTDLSGGVSLVVQEGDEFVVQSNGNYFFLLVTDVNIDESGNGDSYTFNIKK